MSEIKWNLPVSVYDSLLAKLCDVLVLSQRPDEATLTPQAKQAILQATNEFRDAMAKAKDTASSLPGGELEVREQDEVIDMLEQLRDRKRRQLLEFSNKILASAKIPDDTRRDVDSMASTPFDSQ